MQGMDEVITGIIYIAFLRLYFEPVSKVEWKMIFYEKLLDSTEMIINETELLWK